MTEFEKIKEALNRIFKSDILNYATYNEKAPAACVILKMYLDELYCLASTTDNRGSYYREMGEELYANDDFKSEARYYLDEFGNPKTLPDLLVRC